MISAAHVAKPLLLAVACGTRLTHREAILLHGLTPCLRDHRWELIGRQSFHRHLRVFGSALSRTVAHYP